MKRFSIFSMIVLLGAGCISGSQTANSNPDSNDTESFFSQKSDCANYYDDLVALVDEKNESFIFEIFSPGSICYSPKFDTCVGFYQGARGFGTEDRVDTYYAEDMLTRDRIINTSTTTKTWVEAERDRAEYVECAE